MESEKQDNAYSDDSTNIDFVYTTEPESIANDSNDTAVIYTNYGNDIKKLKRSNTYLIIAISILLLINLPFLIRNIYNVFKAGRLNIIGEINGKLLAVDDIAEQFIKLLEEQEDFEVFNTSDSNAYQIYKTDNINSSEARLSIKYANIEDDAAPVERITLSTLCPREKAEETETRFYELAASIFCEPNYKQENKMYIWYYNYTEIKLYIYGIYEEEQEISIMLIIEL